MRKTIVTSMLMGFLMAVAIAGCGPTEIRKPMNTTPPEGMASGAWIDVYDGPGYRGEFRRIWGPKAYHDLTIEGADWDDRIRSVVVGPEAYVRVYRDEVLEGTPLWLVPGQRVEDLNKMKFGDSISSMEIYDQLPSLFPRTSNDPPVQRR